ncbi:MAG: PIN domain-containing protein [Gemmataceae bacterium]
MTPIVAVYDACVLYSAFLRDFFVWLAIGGRRNGILRAKWTGRIHKEWMRAVARRRPELRKNLPRTRRLMDQSVRGCRVHGYERWEARLHLPDNNDRHVLAAALACVADVIVTFNTKDFPESALQPFGISAVIPDTFALHLLDSGIVTTAAAEHRASLRRPALSSQAYVDALRRNGLPAAADALPIDRV